MIHKIKILLVILLFFGFTDTTQISTLDDKYKLIEYDQSELNCLINNVYHEAGIETFQGKLAIAQVTLNRVQSGKFKNNICKTVHQRNRTVCQFSWVCQRKKYVDKNSNAYIASKEAAYQVFVIGHRIKKLNNALYYHANYINPGWNKRKIVTIGKHIFYG